MSLQEVCQSISEYILSLFKNDKDLGVFYCNTLTELGKYFVDKICTNVSGASLEEVQIVVKSINKIKDKSFTDDEFFEYLAVYMGFNKVPRSIYLSLLKKYAQVHKRFLYLNQDIDNRIASIDYEMSKLQDEHDNLVCRSNLKKSVLKDLQPLEEQLLAYISRIADYSTEREMLEYSQKVLVERFQEINCHGDREAIKNNLKYQVFHYVREDSLDINTFFDYYNTILDITKENATDYLRITYTVKLYRFHLAIEEYFSSATYAKTVDEAIEVCKSMASALPSIRELSSAKATNLSEYRRLLTSLIENNSVKEQIVKDIEGNYCLRDRKSLLLSALTMLENREYDIFNNIIVIQLEGLFADYLKDVTTFNRFTDLNLYSTAVLREKIKFLTNLDSGIYTEAILYFNYYFNNRVRNLIAHGNYFLKFKDELSKEVFALELLLDLNFALYMITRESESQKMLRFVHNYKKAFHTFGSEKKNRHFGALLNDLNSRRTHYEYDHIAYTKPMQILYWLVNPYYEHIFSSIGDIEELRDLKKDLLSKEFWGYVLEKLDGAINDGNKFNKVHPFFRSIVNSIFSCTKDTDTLLVLRQVSAKLNQTEYYS